MTSGGDGMVDQQIQNLNKQIIEFSSKIGGLLATVTNLNQNWERNDRDATEGRRVLHGKVDALVSEVGRLSARVDHMSGELAAIKPQVATFDQQHQREIGSRKTLAAIWGVLFALAGAAGAVGVKLLEMFWPPRH